MRSRTSLAFVFGAWVALALVARGVVFPATHYRLRVFEVAGESSVCARDSAAAGVDIGRLQLYDVDGFELPSPTLVSAPDGSFSWTLTPASLFEPGVYATRLLALQTRSNVEPSELGAAVDFAFTTAVTVASYSLSSSLSGSADSDPISWALLARTEISERWTVLDSQIGRAPPARGALYPGAPYAVVENQVWPQCVASASFAYSCYACAPGFSGDLPNCIANSTLACALSPCAGAANCTANVLGRAVCSCPPNTGGAGCSPATNTCGAMCASNSECVHALSANEQRCECSAGYVRGPNGDCIATTEPPRLLGVLSGLTNAAGLSIGAPGASGPWVFAPNAADADVVLTLNFSEPVVVDSQVAVHAVLYRAVGGSPDAPVLWPMAGAARWLASCRSAHQVELRAGWQATLVAAVLNGTVANTTALVLALPAGFVRSRTGVPSARAPAAVNFTIGGLCAAPLAAPAPSDEQLSCFGAVCRTACVRGSDWVSSGATTLTTCTLAAGNASVYTPRVACMAEPPPTVSTILPNAYIASIVTAAPTYVTSAAWTLFYSAPAPTPGTYVLTITGNGFGRTSSDLVDVRLYGELGSASTRAPLAVGGFSWISSTMLTLAVPNTPCIGQLEIATRVHGRVRLDAWVSIVDATTTTLVNPYSPPPPAPGQPATSRCDFITWYTSWFSGGRTRTLVLPGLYDCSVSGPITLAAGTTFFGIPGVRLVLSGAGVGRVLVVSGASVTISHVNLALGFSTADGGALKATSANGLVLRFVTFLYCVAATNGGGMSVSLSALGTLEVSDVVFESTAASSGSGGGLYVKASTVTSVLVERTVFNKTAAYADGGGLLISTSSTTVHPHVAMPVTLRSVTFLSSSASNTGGGAFIVADPTTIDGCVVSKCAAVLGGGVYLTNTWDDLQGRARDNIPTPHVITRSFFSGNTAARGAGLTLDSTDAQLTRDSFTHNAAVFGGGLRVSIRGIEELLDFNLMDCLFASNLMVFQASSQFLAGGYYDAGHMRVYHNVFYRNYAAFAAGVMFDGLQRNTYLRRNLFRQNAVSIIGAGVFLNVDAHVTLDGDEFDENFSLHVGAGVFIYVTSRATLTRVVFRNNFASNRGGALMSLGAVTSFIEGTLESNRAGSSGGAISAIKSVMHVRDTVFRNNSAGTVAGAFELQESSLDATGLLLMNNRAESDAGAMSLAYGSSANVSNSIFSGNWAGLRGGALAMSVGTLTNVTFTANTAVAQGGAVHLAEIGESFAVPFPVFIQKLILDTANATGDTQVQAIVFTAVNVILLTDVTFELNRAARGGALSVASASIPSSLQRCVMNSNTATEAGGGIAFFSGGALTVREFQASSNRADGPLGDGGTIFVSSDTKLGVVLEQLVIVNSTARHDGGAVFIARDAAAMRIAEVSVRQSTAGEYGGAFYVLAPTVVTGRVTVENCTAERGGGVMLAAPLYRETGSAASARIEVSDCKAIEGGGLYLNASVAANVTVPISLMGNTAENGGGGVFYCVAECNNVWRPERLQPNALFAISSDNKAGYGAVHASDGVQLRWTSPPLRTASAAESLESNVVIDSARFLRAEVLDMFGTRVVSTAKAKSVEDRTVKLDVEGSSSVKLVGTLGVLVDNSGKSVFRVVALRTLSSLNLSRPVPHNITLTFAGVGSNPSAVLRHAIDVTTCAGGTERVDVDGVILCVPCAPGRVSKPGLARIVCEPCEPGFFQENPSREACDGCEAGKFSNAAGASECDKCPNGQYSEGNATTCTACPDGATCTGGIRAPEPGWWSPTATGSTLTTVDANAYYECPNPAACLLGRCTGVYDGTLCDKCKRVDETGRKYARVGKGCSKCPSDLESAGLLVLAMGAIVAVLLYFVRSATKSKSEISILLKISIDYMQMLALVSEFTTAARSTFSQFFNFTRSTTASVNIFPIACLWEYSFFSTLALYILIPPLAVLVCLVIYGLRLVFARCRLPRTIEAKQNALDAEWAARETALVEQARDLVGADDEPALAALATRATPMGALAKTLAAELELERNLAAAKRAKVATDAVPKLWRETLNQFISTLSVLYFFAYPSVVRNVLAVFPCHPDLDVLKADVSIVCGTEEHRFYMGLSAIALLVYSVFVPGAAFVFLSRHRSRDVSPRSLFADRRAALYDQRHRLIAATHLASLERFRFLVDGYAPHAVYWEMVTIARKTFICVLLVFLGDKRITQGAFALALLMTFCLLHVHVQPFAKFSLNLAETASLAVLVCTLAGSIAYASPPAGSTAAEMDPTAAVLMVVMNAGFMLSIIVYSLRFLIEHFWDMREERARLAMLKDDDEHSGVMVAMAKARGARASESSNLDEFVTDAGEGESAERTRESSTISGRLRGSAR